MCDKPTLYHSNNTGRKDQHKFIHKLIQCDDIHNIYIPQYVLNIILNCNSIFHCLLFFYTNLPKNELASLAQMFF